MKEEKAFVDFIITGVLILLFSGFYLYKMCMMRKLHKNIQIPRLTLGFHFLGKYGCTYAMLEKKITILISVTFKLFYMTNVLSLILNTHNLTDF